MIAPGTPITRETLEDAVEKAALACARGPVQAAVILDFIECGYVTRELMSIPGRSGRSALFYTTSNGASIGHASWKNLKTRLMRAGFTFQVTTDRDTDGTVNRSTIYLYWSAREGSDSDA